MDNGSEEGEKGVQLGYQVVHCLKLARRYAFHQEVVGRYQSMDCCFDEARTSD